MYIRQFAAVAAVFGTVAFAGLLPDTSAFANDTATSNMFYDVINGHYVTIDVAGPGTYGQEIDTGLGGGTGGEPAGRLEDQASLPDHIRRTLTTK